MAWFLLRKIPYFLEVLWQEFEPEIDLITETQSADWGIGIFSILFVSVQLWPSRADFQKLFPQQ